MIARIVRRRTTGTKTAARRRGIALTVMTLLASGATGCGGGDDESPPDPSVVSKIRQVQAAFDAGRFEAVCDDLTERAQLMIGFSGHNTKTRCVSDVRKLRTAMRAGPGGAPPPTVVATEDRPGGVVATVQAGEGPSVDVPLARVGGELKIDGVFSARASSFQRRNGLPAKLAESAVDVAVATDESDRGAEPAVWSGSDEDGRDPCPALSKRTDTATGGCQLQLSATHFRFDVANALGVMPFADCRTGLSINVDHDGRALVTGWSAIGLGGCGDVRMCTRRDVPVPWPASVTRTDDGGVRLHVQTCLDTCVGLYEGEWTVDLEQARNGRWRLRAQDAAVGRSGFSFAGLLDSGYAGWDISITES